MYTVDALLKDLKKSSGELEDLRLSPFFEENELIQAAYALSTKEQNLNPFRPQLFPLASGAIPLFRKSFFPWGGLPYPKEHAQLGALLAHLGDSEMSANAHRMAHFQEATLDHHCKPLYSLFHQEGAPFSSLAETTALFFEAVQLKPAESVQFTDHELIMIAKRNNNTTLACMGSGCKSGMGLFLFQDAGVINYGPQVLPFGECSAFGLAGRALKGRMQENGDLFNLSYQCRLAAPHIRQTGFSHLQDSGYSGLWIESQVEGSLKQISVATCIEGFVPLNQIAFSFFGKGKECLVSGSHKLKPRSLDRYQGPCEPIVFLGDEGGVELKPIEGVSRMEVIPLAGDESFWGADFLVGFILDSPTVKFELSLKKNA